MLCTLTLVEYVNISIILTVQKCMILIWIQKIEKVMQIAG